MPMRWSAAFVFARAKNCIRFASLPSENRKRTVSRSPQLGYIAQSGFDAVRFLLGNGASETHIFLPSVKTLDRRGTLILAPLQKCKYFSKVPFCSFYCL